MTHSEFNYWIDELEKSRALILDERNGKYSHDDEALYNFKEAAKIMGCTPAQAAWNYATKHIIALRDMICNDNFSDKPDLCEKIRDIQNYLSFIWAIANENRCVDLEAKEHKGDTSFDYGFIPDDDSVICERCKYFTVPCAEEPCCSCRHYNAHTPDLDSKFEKA